MNNNLEQHLNKYFSKLQKELENLDKTQVVKLVELMLEVYQNNGVIYTAGNGGSAAMASHFACDISKNTAYDFKIIPLTSDAPTILAWANDEGYENIFSGQLKNLLRKQDMLILFSGSGNSKNVLKAAQFANKIGAKTFCFTGYDGGELKKICTNTLHVNINDMQVSEDVHLIITHAVMQFLNT